MTTQSSIPNEPEKPNKTIDLIAVLVLCVFTFFLGLVLPFKVIFYLLAGWISHLSRLLSGLTISMERTTWFLGALIVFTVGIHFACRKWYQRNHQTHTETVSAQPDILWQKRWTLTLVAMLLMLLVSGICVISMTHQAYWMATTDDVLINHDLRQAARNSTSKNNLKQIGLALHHYHDSFNQLPSGGIINEIGQPQHSWISHMLPYLDQPILYKEIDFNQPWNAEVNRRPFETVLSMFMNPGLHFQYDNGKSDKENSKGYQPTHYAANSRLLSNNSKISLSQIKDGASNTILAGEIKSNIKPWGDPRNFRDPALGINQSQQGFGGPYKGGANILFSDGSARFLSDKIDPKVLKALSTPNGGELIGEF
ncbi:DUF1559 domain-containing protein [Gimesia aquarii]|uniref:DUF1559 domain-containing protein n=1 Tax=Gimesia aquarii TaxID=2527964 RepID=A0A517VNN9_9PLAN|nr:DUF1559 domain-containing protein [Gimesia aquarii]QDT94625.1 hypothetical protein V144x_00550 [Gimesia aquarii]